jgi:hypothetical protein
MTMPTAGPAILHLHRGTYVADGAELSGGIVTYRGRRRERDLQGDRLYELHTRSVKLRAGEWVEWVGRHLEVAT